MSSDLIRSSHVRGCPGTAFGQSHGDAAKRVADEYNMHRIAGGYDAIGKWIACALADGRSDHQLYDSKSDAIRFQHGGEQLFMYLQIRPTTMWDCDAHALLTTHRRMYDNGIRLVDPDHRAGGREAIRRTAREDMKGQLRTIRSGGTIRPTNLDF